ncbi:MAG TPA: hypothetical protein VF823_00595, partial [Anaerolineales bacterium]
MGRQVFLVFFGEPRSAPAEHAQENPALMTVPLVILAFFSVIAGALNLPGVHTFTNWLGHTIHEGGAAAATAAGEAATAGQSAQALGGFNPGVALLATVLALAAIFLAWVLYYRRYRELQKLPTARRPDDPLRPILGPVFTWLQNKWYIDELYWAVIGNPYNVLSKFLADVVDWRFWHDWFHDTVIAGGYRKLSQLLAVQVDLGGIDAAANGLAVVTQGFAARLRRSETGFVRNYALAVFLGVVVIVGYLMLR